MAVYLGIEKENEKRGRITLIHYDPQSLPKEMLKEGIVVERFEEVKVPEGKVANAYWNYQTQSVEYEFSQRELTSDEKLSSLQEENSMLQSALTEMTEYLALQDKRINTQEEALLELTTMIAGGIA